MIKRIYINSAISNPIRCDPKSPVRKRSSTAHIYEVDGLSWKMILWTPKNGEGGPPKISDVFGLRRETCGPKEWSLDSWIYGILPITKLCLSEGFPGTSILRLCTPRPRRLVVQGAGPRAWCRRPIAACLATAKPAWDGGHSLRLETKWHQVLRLSVFLFGESPATKSRGQTVLSKSLSALIQSGPEAMEMVHETLLVTTPTWTLKINTHTPWKGNHTLVFICLHCPLFL